MNEELAILINNFKRDKRIFSFDEAATKQAVIMRILSCLGWDPFNIDEIYPEYSVGNKRVDYALRYNDKNKVFIEVKKIGEDLEKHQEQLLKYSFEEGVKLAILTNGISWWFYLPLYEGNWEQRKFYTIELYDQKTEDIVEKFEEFLSKENVASDKAIENAEKIYRSIQKRYLIKDTLPKAWEKIMTEPDELLVELLAYTVERLCGYKPDYEIVRKFLMENWEVLKSSKKEIQPTERVLPKNISINVFGNYTGRSIESFTFKGEKYYVRSWKEMLIKICELMYAAHKNQFGKILNLTGKKRPYFTRNPNELRSPEKIRNTDIFVETNLNANQIVRISKEILLIFGYREDDISIKLK